LIKRQHRSGQETSINAIQREISASCVTCGWTSKPKGLFWGITFEKLINLHLPATDEWKLEDGLSKTVPSNQSHLDRRGQTALRLV